MSREILFRGKRIDNGEWVEGLPYKAKYGGISAIVNENEERFVIIPETLGQFTGLTDKNGKRVFEQDIVKTKFGRLCTVVWFSSPEHNGWDLIVYNRADVIFTKSPDKFDLYAKYNLEVIGNKWDNGLDVDE